MEQLKSWTRIGNISFLDIGHQAMNDRDRSQGFPRRCPFIRCLLRPHSPNRHPAVAHQLIPCPPPMDHQLFHKTQTLSRENVTWGCPAWGYSQEKKLCVGCKPRQERTCSSSGAAQPLESRGKSPLCYHCHQEDPGRGHTLFSVTAHALVPAQAAA